MAFVGHFFLQQLGNTHRLFATATNVTSCVTTSRQGDIVKSVFGQ